MAWAITLEISDCAVPTFKIQGASISDGTALGTGLTDANGQLIYGIADDSITQYLVQISHTGSTVHAANGYISKNFILNKSSSNTIQSVCLNPAPNPEPGTGGGDTSVSCFIVSATTGSADSAEVVQLRLLRDRVAQVSGLGGHLIEEVYREYAEFSPAIAHELERDALAKKAALWVVVRPLLAWYTLAGTLALEKPDRETIEQARRELLDACPLYLGGASILELFEGIRDGQALPADSHALVREFGSRMQHAARLRFAGWAIFEPLVRAWRAANGKANAIDEVGQWLAGAPLEVLSAPAPDALERELGALARFFDFKPSERHTLGRRLMNAWPGARSALERAGFLSPTSTQQQEN